MKKKTKKLIGKIALGLMTITGIATFILTKKQDDKEIIDLKNKKKKDDILYI